MEKNKLKISKLGKVGKIVPALLAAGFLSCASLSAESMKYNNYKEAPHVESTSLGKTATSYEKAITRYSAVKSEKTLKNIVTSDLNKMTKYDRLEIDVQNEVVGHLANMNANTLELAQVYKAMEENTFANSGMTVEEMEKVVKNAANGGGTDQVNVLAARDLMQHFMHMALDTQTLIRFRAEEAEISVMDEKDGHNEYLRFRTKGERDLRKESTAVLSTLKNDIIDGVRYEYEVKGQNGQQIAKIVKANFNQIETLVAKKDFNENDYQKLIQLIYDTADLLPSTMFGTQAMRRGLITEFGMSHAMNRTLTVLADLNYDINNFKAGAYAKAAKTKPVTKQNITSAKKTDTTFNASAYTNVTNQHAGVNLSANATIPLEKNWDLVVGGEINPSAGYNGGMNYTQFLGTAEAGKILTNNDRFSFGLKTGVQADTKGASVPFGFNTGYNWQINNNFSLDFGINTLFNIQRSYSDLGASVGVTYRAKWGTIKFGVGFGYTFDWNKTAATTIKPTSTGADPYGTDEVYIPEPGTETDEGDITDMPDMPVDITKY